MRAAAEAAEKRSQATKATTKTEIAEVTAEAAESVKAMTKTEIVAFTAKAAEKTRIADGSAHVAEAVRSQTTEALVDMAIRDRLWDVGRELLAQGQKSGECVGRWTRAQLVVTTANRASTLGMRATRSTWWSSGRSELVRCS